MPTEDETTAFWKRIDYLIGDERPFSWSDRVGINKGTFQSARNRGSKPLSRTLDKWANKIGCNAHWLKTGEGDPWEKPDPDEEVKKFIESAPNAFIADDAAREKRIMIALYDVKVCCGDGVDSFDFEPLKKELPFDESFFKKRNRKPVNCKLVYATNDSMHPYIGEGDAVMIDVSVIDPRDGQVYAIWFEGERMFKRIFKEAGGVLRLTSDNTKYPDKVVTEDNGADFRIIGEQFYRSG